MKGKLINIILSGYMVSKIFFSKKYKRFHLGFFWTFFPTIILLIGTIISSKQMNFKEFGFEHHYTLYVILPFVIYRAITESFDLTCKLNQYIFILERTFTTKAYSVFIGSFFSGFFFLIFDIVLSLILVIIFYKFSALSFLLYLFLFFISIAVGVFLGMLVGPLSILVYDLRNFSKFLRVFILTCAPIFYLKPKDGIVSYINDYNPFTYIIEHSREILLNNNNEMIYYIFPILIIFFIIFFNFFKFYDHQKKILNSSLVKGNVGVTISWINSFKKSKK